MSSLNPDTVVLAEDETLFRDFLRQSVENKLGLTVAGEAGDGLAAEKVCLDKRPELLVTDLRLPGIHGDELAKRLLKSLPGLKILVVSAVDSPQVGLELLSAGCGDSSISASASMYLSKPSRRCSTIASSCASDH
jgi:DNA-binding NarL/FixJ family response regulator